VELVERFGPTQPDSLAEWGRTIAEAPYPLALNPFDPRPDVGAPPEVVMPADVDAAARAATVKVVGGACDRVQEGTGFVAARGLVVTNAHVVAGERDTIVADALGARHDAAVVVFDPDRDLAVLAVPDLGAAPLEIAAGDVGDTGAVYGHPGGGPLRVSPARIAERIEAVGTDIYLTSKSRRDVFVLAAELEPGDSGAALVDLAGRVIGVAFAIDGDDPGIAYALSDTEVRSALDAIETFEVDTGPCLVG
jgi:S1-C subfamily serine protease